MRTFIKVLIFKHSGLETVECWLDKEAIIGVYDHASEQGSVIIMSKGILYETPLEVDQVMEKMGLRKNDRDEYTYCGR